MTHNTCSLTLAYIYTNSLLITNNSNKFHLLLMLLFLRYFHCRFLMVTLLFTFRASNDTQHMQSHKSIYTNSLLITNNNYFHLLLMLMLLFRIVMDTIIIIRLCWFYITLLTVKVMVPHLLPLFICIVNLLYNMTTR